MKNYLFVVEDATFKLDLALRLPDSMRFKSSTIGYVSPVHRRESRAIHARDVEGLREASALSICVPWMPWNGESIAEGRPCELCQRADGLT